MAGLFCAAIPRWEPYDLTRRQTMVFDTPSRLADDPRGAERRLFESLKSKKGVEEIFEHVKKELMRCGYFDGLAAGAVLAVGRNFEVV